MMKKKGRRKKKRMVRQSLVKEQIQEVIRTHTASKPFRLPKEDHGVIPLVHKRLATPQGSKYPTLSEQWCGFFYVSQEPNRS